MCQYFGGKIKIGKEISKIILEHELSIKGNNDSTYFEPFIGMAGVFRHVVNEGCRECIGCDKHEDLIIMWECVKNGWVPPKQVSREQHLELKNGNPSALRSFVGFGCSFMGIFFSGYTEKSVLNSYNQIISISNILQGKDVSFLKNSDYNTHNPHNMTIYCDPPYTESYKSNNMVKQFKKFDHDLFWKTMREWSIDNLVFISETTAPSDFFCIWEKKTGKNFYRKNGFYKEKKGRTERLFCHESYKIKK